MTAKTVNSSEDEALEEIFLDISFTISLEPYVCSLFANILYFPYTISLYLCLLILFNGEQYFSCHERSAEYIPDGDDVADAASENEEVEDAVHVLPLIETVEQGTGDVADTLGHNPYNGCRGNAVDERLEGYEHAEAHADEAERLDVGVLFEADETDDGAHDGTEPHKNKESPAPVALLTEGDKGEGRVGAGYVPVDGGVVPAAQAFLPFGMMADGVVDGGGYVGA